VINYVSNQQPSATDTIMRRVIGHIVLFQSEPMVGLELRRWTGSGSHGTNGTVAHPTFCPVALCSSNIWTTSCVSIKPFWDGHFWVSYFYISKWSRLQFVYWKQRHQFCSVTVIER